MTQTWDPRTYEKNAAFVHESAGEVLEWLAAQPGERILDLGCGDGQLTLPHRRHWRGCRRRRCIAGDGCGGALARH